LVIISYLDVIQLRCGPIRPLWYDCDPTETCNVLNC